ncbi:hypothetical protein OS493_032033 [Desmophyllum pertusum]|uniref:Uncharacterized protein n=1 Tax=Desmophyllum pertusum TaxID=174260 RepID=A0A9X0CR62_9CNID|nr:hypothetical protein OS493_032033 [Desmophyllum pertusum]
MKVNVKNRSNLTSWTRKQRLQMKLKLSREKNQELVAREELVDTLNSAPEMLDAADGKSGGSETEKYGLSFQLHSQSLAKNAPNSANDLPSAPTHEFRENVPSESTGAVQSNGQSQVDGEEKKKPEHVSDLVSMWNSKTEVYDI